MTTGIKILFFIFKVLNTLILKSKNKVLFISRPDYADNTKHMYDYMLKHHAHNKKLSWIIYDKYAYDILLSQGIANIFYLKSFRGVYEYMTSKYIFTSSSSLWQIKSPFQVQFGLWHGIPLKTILCMGESGVGATRQAGNINMRFATSNLTKALLSASFDYNAKKIQVTGQPRTDCLLKDTKKLYEFLEIKSNAYTKVVMYMPTYRSGYRDKQDGTTISGDNIFRFNTYHHEKFISFLKENDILFLMKLHPYEEKVYKDLLKGDNLFMVSHDDLLKKNLDIHELLADVDTLITDYSSVYFDYLLLDKKIIFVPTDKDIYERERGFNLQPYDFWTPGAKIYTQEALEEELILEDVYVQERKVVRDIIHTYQDNNACERVYSEVKQYF